MAQILKPEEVCKRYGKMFCQDFLTMVDEERGIGQIVERCIAKGPCEWDLVNRNRTRGVITDIRTDGTTLVMDTVLGERPLNFGPVSKDMGGQGLSAMKVEGDEVRTTWYGIAGASVGIGACIPQCPQVIRTEYPDDFRMGGAHQTHVDIVTPKLVRVIIGIDDTDTKENGATWAAGLKLGTRCPIGHFIDHKIIQLNPKAPNKTTNCCSTAISFAVRENEIEPLVDFCVDFIRKESYSEDAVLTVFKGLSIPEPLSKYGWDAKSILFTTDEAEKIAAETGVRIIKVTGNKGVIGAVAAIGCFDMGAKAAGIPEDFR